MVPFKHLPLHYGLCFMSTAFRPLSHKSFIAKPENKRHAIVSWQLSVPSAISPVCRVSRGSHDDHKICVPYDMGDSFTNGFPLMINISRIISDVVIHKQQWHRYVLYLHHAMSYHMLNWSDLIIRGGGCLFVSPGDKLDLAKVLVEAGTSGTGQIGLVNITVELNQSK